MGKVVIAIVIATTLLSCGADPEKAAEKSAPAEQAQQSGSQGGEALPTADLLPCEGPDADPWVAGLRERSMSSDMLASYAA
jgi:hypothetical protein